MNINRTPLLFVMVHALAMMGCGSSPTQQYPAVPISDTNAFLQEMEANQKESAEQRSEMRNSIVEHWLQPANITEPCKVIYNSPEGADGVTVYWDGRCQDGYAKGLGRAFLETDQGLTAFLEEYPGGSIKPKSHYFAAYDYNKAAIGDASEGGAKQMAAYNTPNGFYLWQAYFQLDEVNWIGHSYETYSNTDVSTWRRIYADGSSLNFYQNNDLSHSMNFGGYYTDKEGKPIGYAVNVYRNGAVEHLSWIGGQKSNVSLPKAFTDQMNQTMQETREKVSEAYQASENSRVALEIYKRKVCNGDITVDYIDSGLYGQICLEYGDMSKLSKQIAAAEAEAISRQEANKDRALRQQEIAANTAAAQASQNAANASYQAAQMQSFSNSMQESAQNMATFTNSMIIANQNNNTPNFGVTPQKKVLNCFQMGNIVSCQ